MPTRRYALEGGPADGLTFTLVTPRGITMTLPDEIGVQGADYRRMRVTKRRIVYVADAPRAKPDSTAAPD